MFASSRIVKALAATVMGAALALAGAEAQAQISGSIGGDLVDVQLIEEEGIYFEVPNGAVLVPTGDLADALTDGTSNTIFVSDVIMVSGHAVALDGPRRVRISADVTTADAAGAPRTTRISATLIGLLAPGAAGLADYADDDACRLSDGGTPGDAELRACALLSLRFTAFIDQRRLAVSPAAVMAQTARGIAIWDPR